MELNDIGNTELIELTSLSINNNSLFSKCELNNPTGSHKDRTFLYIINSLEEENKIAPGMTLIDCSTGNGGAALAWIGQKKGYKVKIFMPEGMTEERKEQIYSFGGEIIETPKESFLKGAVEAATEYSNHQKNIFFLNQSDTTLNKDAWHSCGEEIVIKMNEINKEPDYFICSIGTGGTFSGIAEILKNAYPRIRTVGIEVDQSAPIYSQRHGLNFQHKHHNLMGLGAGVISVNTLLDLIDEVRVVNGKAAWERMKSFIEKERLGIGPTCGANLLITEDIMQEVNGKVIVTLFFDSAWKYKSRWNGVYPGYKETQ